MHIMFQEGNYVYRPGSTYKSTSIKKIVLAYHSKISIVYKVVPYNQPHPVQITAQLTSFPQVVGRVTPSSQQITLVRNDEVFLETMLILFFVRGHC